MKKNETKEERAMRIEVVNDVEEFLLTNLENAEELKLRRVFDDYKTKKTLEKQAPKGQTALKL